MQHTGIDRSRQQVIGGGDGMNIACQVQVEIFHGYHLAISTACCAAFNPKGRALRRLPDACKDFLAQVGTQCLAQAHHGGAFALTQRRWGDCCNIDILAIRNIL
jgi:hypothetical protein